MAGGKTDYLEDEILDHVLGKGARNFTSPPALWVAIYGDGLGPGEAGGGTEKSGHGYARQSITFNAASGGSATGDSSGVLDFYGPNGASGSAPGSLGHFAILDSSAGGNMLYYGDLSTVKTLAIGDILRIPQGGLTVTET